MALDGDNAFVSASDSPFTRRGSTCRARLGSPFTRCEGLPDFDGNIDSGHLDAAAGRVAVGFAYSVYLSEDEGNTWNRAAAVPGRVTAVRFALR